MKVLYIADQYNYGGAAMALIEMITILRNCYGVEPIVGTAFNDALADELDKHDIPHLYLGHRQFAFNYDPRRGIIRLNLYKPLYWLRYYFANKKAINNAKKLIKKGEIDLVHSNVDRNDVGGLIAKKFQVPHIWHIREYTSGHFNLVFNNIRPFEYMNDITSTFVSISNAVANDWIKSGLDSRKVKTIYDGVEIGRIKVKDEKIDRSILKIICVGEISEAKGQIVLLEALSRCIKNNMLFKLDIYGNGNKEYIESLVRKAESLNIQEYICFKGYSKNVQNFLCDYDIGINTSSGEGFGRTTVEYMAAGLVTIIKNDDLSNELIGHEEYGYTFKDEEQLSNVLIEIATHRKDAYRKGVMARERSIELFDIEHNAARFYELYLSLSR